MLRTLGRSATSVACWALFCLSWPSLSVARSPEEPTNDPAIARASLAPNNQPVPGRSGRSGSAQQKGETRSGWWLGPVGIAAALAVVGGLSLASKRFGWNLGMVREVGPLRVVGQTRLSPKQSVYLLRVGDRVLIVGTGPGGPPSPLGEVTDPSELARLIPPRSNPSGTVAVTGVSRPNRSNTGFDRRIGDDE